MIERYIYLVLAGMAGGLIGGMGMGGGTLLIPLLTIFLDVPQHVAQWINLLAFVPMAIVALIIHFKHKLLIYKQILPILIPALFSAVLASFLAVSAQALILKRLFGGFLILMGLFSLVLTFVEYRKNKKEKETAQKN